MPSLEFLTGGGSGRRQEMKWGCFCKKWTFSPQNETKLMLDLFVILLTHPTHPLPPGGLGLLIILSQKFNHVILLFECYMPVEATEYVWTNLSYFSPLCKRARRHGSLYTPVFTVCILVDLLSSI